MTAPAPGALDWRNIAFLGFVHLGAAIGLALYLPLHGLTWAAAGICLGLTVVSIFAISGGYHRLFSHRTYEAHWLLRFFYLTFGAGNFQNSAMVWSADHRRHHARTDSDLDPYSATRGFWYAHIGWVLRKTDPSIPQTPVKDLERDPLVIWQHRYYPIIGTVTGFGVPVALGFLFGDPWGGFVLGAMLRLVFVYHATFSINSIAHIIGAQPYSMKNSARDSFVTALISMGEGYHNFHHTFPADYRNGVRAYQFDPTKWLLRSFAVIGLARKLRRTPQANVVRARLRVDAQRLAEKRLAPATQERLERLQSGIENAIARWHAAVARYEEAKREAQSHTRTMMRAWRAEVKEVRRELRSSYAAWQRALRSAQIAGP